MGWRVIELETHDPFLNMSIDEALCEGVRDGRSPPTIRFYRWSPSSVSIGRFQSMNDEVDIERCNELGIGYVRRTTGGGAVYHDLNGEVTYSIIAPESAFPKGIIDSYKEICNYVIRGLANLAMQAEFAPINDILVEGKKISGNAQTRRDKVLLQHGTVLYALDVKKMFTILKISQEKVSDKLIKSVEERVTCVSRYKEVSIEDLYAALLKGFTQGIDYAFGKLDESESERAHELAESLYSTREWNFSR